MFFGLVSNEIKLNKVTFLYPNKTRPALEDISLTIKPNTFVGIVGTSGSGKSTLVDVIIGLIKSQKGEVIIDGKPLTQQNLKSWQNKIGFVMIRATPIMEIIQTTWVLLIGQHHLQSIVHHALEVGI